LIVVGPVFVTVDAPRTPKWAAVPSGTGVAVAAVAATADPAAPISKAVDATARTAIAASRNEEVILRIMPVMVVTMGFLFLDVFVRPRISV
jgi:hypothetical protein